MQVGAEHLPAGLLVVSASMALGTQDLPIPITVWLLPLAHSSVPPFP